MEFVIALISGRECDLTVSGPVYMCEDYGINEGINDKIHVDYFSYILLMMPTLWFSGSLIFPPLSKQC